MPFASQEERKMKNNVSLMIQTHTSRVAPDWNHLSALPTELKGCGITYQRCICSLSQILAVLTISERSYSSLQRKLKHANPRRNESSRKVLVGCVKSELKVPRCLFRIRCKQMRNGMFSIFRRQLKCHKKVQRP